MELIKKKFVLRNTMISLRTTHKKAIDLLNKRIMSVSAIQKDEYGNKNFYAVLEWAHTTQYLLEAIYGHDDEHTTKYLGIIKNIPTQNKQRWAQETIYFSLAMLKSNINEIQTILENPEFQEPISNINAVSSDEKLLFIFSKFHNIAKILELHRKNCSCFSIKKEYDVQLLIYSLLTLGFEHIRVEEPTGSHAGSASRMDFVLDDEKTIIEIKYAFEGHVDNEIGEELLLDIAKYEANGKYSKFFCLIYDPNNKIRNAPILKKDLEMHKKEHFDITVIIEPKR
jgi:hypothetical protein